MLLASVCTADDSLAYITATVLRAACEPSHPCDGPGCYDRVRGTTMRFGFLSTSLLAVGLNIGAATATQKEPTAVDPAQAGWNTDALNEVEAYVQSQRTTGFLIIEDRK